MIPGHDYYRLEFIASHWGENAQLRKMVEEMGELIRASMRWLNRKVRPDQADLENFLEECADVLLMVHQVVVLMGQRGVVERTYEEKLDAVFNHIVQMVEGEVDDE